MKINIIAIWLILLFQTNVFAQSGNDSLYLVKTFVSEASLDSIQEMNVSVFNARNAAQDKNKIKVVIRLCTSKPILRAAVVQSVWLYPTIIKTFESDGFERRNIIVVKSADCPSAKGKSRMPTEIWITDNENSLPSHTEKYSAQQIEIKEIGDSGYYDGDSDYLKNAEKLSEELKNDESAFGFILGFYINSSAQKRMTAKINKSAAVIKKRGLRSSKYQAEVIKITNWLAAGEPKYPLFYAVKIERTVPLRIKETK